MLSNVNSTPPSASSVVQSPTNTTSTSNITQNATTLAQQIQQKRESTKKQPTLKAKQQSEGPSILSTTPAMVPIANNQANSSLSINPSSANTTSNNSSTSNLVLSTSLPLNVQTNTRLQSNTNASNSPNSTPANLGPQSSVQPLLTRQRKFILAVLILFLEYTKIKMKLFNSKIEQLFLLLKYYGFCKFWCFYLVYF